jgi:hypothetical protein
MQAITLSSKNKFKIVQQSDSVTFLSWVLNALHNHLCKKIKGREESIISDSFQGELLVETFTIIKDDTNYSEDAIIEEIEGTRYIYQSKTVNFLYIIINLVI